ncbi:MAG: hypothetical protein CM15mP49_00400 [Actinomycetota bacterium]|nr:MAG: hypothetical protein CM15mP49_00400 [Actinomycetota bacterium]
MVQLRHDVVGIDASILSPPAVWKASGHLENFSDPLVDCKECNERFRRTNLRTSTPVPPAEQREASQKLGHST